MCCSPIVWERRQALSCQETRELIHGYLDGEVDLVKSVEIEDHFRNCHACTQTYKGIRSLRSVGTAAKCVSPIHAVVNGVSESQNSRCRFAQRIPPVTRCVRCSM